MKKIVIIGPESTGKSTLCQQLADHFHTEWVPEYARQYLLEHGTEYSYEDLLTIAKGQIALEDKFIEAVGKRTSPETPLFIDTDMYVMKVWCEFVFDRCHQWILDTIVQRKYDLYLLCNTDLPWIKDDLREYPDLESRQALYHIYKDIMVNQHIPWVDVSGGHDQRFQTALSGVKKLMKNINI